MSFILPPDAPTSSGKSEVSNGRPLRQSRWSKLSYRLTILIATLLALSAVVTTTFAVRSVQNAMYDQTIQSMENVHA